MEKIHFISEDLKRFLSIAELTEVEINDLSTLLKYSDVPAGEVILSEGEINHKLYFLVNGEVEIIRSGEVIATLSHPGDTLGEMSLITEQPCSASTVAKSKTSLLSLDITQLGTLSENVRGILSNALNRMFSVILAKKLASTNEKARMFEITNRELKEAKVALERASREKIDELNAKHKAIYKRLKSILDHEIIPMRNETKDPAAVARLNQLLSSLEPLLHGFDSHQDIRKSRILLLEDDINEQMNAKMSLGGTGVEYQVCATRDAAIEAILGSKFNMICLNNQFVDLMDLAKKHQPETQFVFVTSEPIAEHFKTLKDHPELSTILARHPEDRGFTIKNMATTIQKLSSDDIFGMEKYLNWGTEPTDITVTGSAQRSDVISKLENYVDSLGIRGPLKRKAVKVAEELLMNAIYDAPTDKNGKSIYNHHDRTVAIELKPDEYAQFRFACDGNFLAISVIDRFGALGRSTILDYLARCFTEAAGTGVEGKGGGGNGLYQIIQSSSLTVFNVKPGHRTEVIALININVQIEKISLHPSFHYFEKRI
jgi:CRP-like cAMP-binding protein